MNADKVGAWMLIFSLIIASLAAAYFFWHFAKLARALPRTLNELHVFLSASRLGLDVSRERAALANETLGKIEAVGKDLTEKAATTAEAAAVLTEKVSVLERAAAVVPESGFTIPVVVPPVNTM